MKNHILIVDDEPINRFVLKQILTPEDCTLYEAADGQDALYMLEKHPDINIVLLDLNMPNIDGYAFLHHLNESSQYADRQLNVIIVSATMEAMFRDMAKAGGINTGFVRGYIQKPVNKTTVINEINALSTVAK